MDCCEGTTPFVLSGLVLQIHNILTITKTVDNIQAQFTSATLSGPPKSLMSSSKVLGGNALLRMSSLSNSSFFIALHKSAAELEGNDGLLDDDIKLESAGALAEWCSVVKCPEEK